MEDDLNRNKKMEDNLPKKDGRRPQKNKNGRRPQKKTLKKMEDEPKKNGRRP
jgi:hypothetical protein